MLPATEVRCLDRAGTENFFGWLLLVRKRTVQRSTVPVGRSWPVLAPTVPTQLTRISAPVPGTPGIAQSPRTRAFPAFTFTEAISAFPVLVFQIRTSATPSCTSTMPSSIANGPTSEETLPQLPLYPT